MAQWVGPFIGYLGIATLVAFIAWAIFCPKASNKKHPLNKH